jgi:ATP-dependent DNA helicase RecQ
VERSFRASSVASRNSGGFGFAATHVIDVLRGKVTDKVTRFGHERLSTFGIGGDRSEAEWRLLLRQLVAQHLVEVDYDRYNVLRLTEASRDVLRGERRIELRMQVAEPRRRAKGRRAVAAEGLDAPAERLFRRLREWRAAMAKEHGVPAYVVFHDGTLRAIAQQRPDSLAALGEISGVGAAKLARYGAAVLELAGEAGKA